MMKKLSRVLVLIAYILILGFQILPTVNLASDEKDMTQAQGSTTSSPYTLNINKKTAVVEVRDESKDRSWFSAPQNVNDDELANPINREMLQAQIQIQYMDSSFKSYKMNSYTDSVKLDQYEIEEIPNGYRVEYLIGEQASELLLPEVISEERMAEFYDQMDKKEKKQIKRNYNHVIWDELDAADKSNYLELYENVEGKNFFAIRSNVKDFKKEELAEYFEAYGYTLEERAKDHEEMGFANEEEKANFLIPISYMLDDDSLVVEVDTAAIEYDSDSYYLTNISVVPSFDAAGIDDEGYIFVPDGSGSLIYLNNGKTTEAAYVQNIYGEDYTLEHLEDTSMYKMNRLNIHMPIFGLKRNDQAFLAIIESSEALGTINADISGKSHSFNTVGASFTYLDNGPLHSSKMLGTNQIQLFTTRDPEHMIRIRYYFLQDDEADYVGMAKCYRQYLLKAGGLLPAEMDEDLPFAVEFIGAIDKDQTKFGVKYNAPVALTTYSQADKIIEELQEQQIQNIVPIFSGWMNEGLHNTAPMKIKPVKKLEDSMGTEEYLHKVIERGLTPVFTVDFQKVYKNRWFDGYTAQSMAPRYFDRSIVRLGEIDYVDEEIKEHNINLISPAKVQDVAHDVVDELQDYEGMGLNVATLGADLYSDMMPEKEVNRREAMDMNCDALSYLADTIPFTIANRPNAYAWPYVDLILNAPETANLYRITDVSVPVYQIVLSGLVPYTGTVLNINEDYSESMLKAAETGAGFYCMWSYEENSEVKGTDFDQYYSLHYLPWIDQITENYRELNKSIGHKTIVDHQILDNDLRCTTFEDGTYVYTNYSDEPAEIDGVTIAARSYKILGGLS